MIFYLFSYLCVVLNNKTLSKIMENSKIDFNEEDLQLLKLLKGYVGAYVKVDMAKCPNYYKELLAKGQQYFHTNIVGLEKFNCRNNGFLDNEAHLTGYPDPNGSNWCMIDVNSICGIVDSPLFTISSPHKQSEDRPSVGLECSLTSCQIDDEKAPNLLARHLNPVSTILRRVKRWWNG